jgi:uncharacterized damage-inducible protein DinB
MIRSLDDFFDEWREESAATLKLMRTLNEASLSQEVSPGGRTLGRLAWHVALSISEMLEHAGLTVESVPQDSPVPLHAAEIADRYELDSAAIAPALRIHWTDDMLEEEVPMYGEMWKRGTVLSVLIRHQTHHRGQMTVLMRQAGLPVAGVYGPAKEEWAAMGLPPMA